MQEKWFMFYLWFICIYGLVYLLHFLHWHAQDIYEWLVLALECHSMSAMSYLLEPLSLCTHLREQCNYARLNISSVANDPYVVFMWYKCIDDVVLNVMMLWSMWWCYDQCYPGGININNKLGNKLINIKMKIIGHSEVYIFLRYIYGSDSAVY